MSVVAETDAVDLIGHKSFSEYVVEAIMQMVPSADPRKQTVARALRLITALMEHKTPVTKVEQWARVAATSRRTLGRTLKIAGFPGPKDWQRLHQMLWAQRALMRGCTVRTAALAGGYPDPFTYSNQMYRVLKVRPKAMAGRSPAVLARLYLGRMEFNEPLTCQSCPFCGTTLG